MARKYAIKRLMTKRAMALELEGISAGYGETVVLEDIKLSLAEGESISIIGRRRGGRGTVLHVRFRSINFSVA